MVHQIFAALKAKDEKAFLALQPSAEQMLEQMKKTVATVQQEMAKYKHANKQNDSTVLAQLEKLATPEAIADARKIIVRGFQAIVKEGEEKGVDWNKIKLIGYTIDRTDTNLVNAGERYKQINAVADFVVNDSSYQLSFMTQASRTSGEWSRPALLYVLRKGEKPDEEVYEKKEITIETVEDVPPPPPPPLPRSNAKSKAKQKASNTKPKTKS